jgi:hypothetical protein
MILLLKLASVVMLLLAALHTGFSRRFGWKTELASLSLINQQLMKVHTFFIALVLLLMGLLCLLATADLLVTSLGRIICSGYAFFWAVRLYFQFWVYAPSLWKGKRFETVMHILFSAIWIFLTLVFGCAAFFNPAV